MKGCKVTNKLQILKQLNQTFAVHRKILAEFSGEATSKKFGNQNA